MSSRILLSGPDISELEVRSVIESLRSGWAAPVGPDVELFEKEIAAFTGTGHAVALSSGTAALHLGLKALGVQPGDAVVTSTMTFVATANAISYIGAKPVFVDSLDDGSPDPALVRDAVQTEQQSGRRIGAIVPVDIYGRVANYSEMLPISESYGVPVLADAAESLGASRNGRMAGSWGDAAVLSFNGNKIMTTSGGGMFLTSDPEKAGYVRYLATQAREPAVHYEHTEIGYNYRMSSVCAALGRAQLSRLPDMIRRRKERRVQYEDYFSNVEGASMLPGDIEEDNCWLSSILVDVQVAGWSSLELLDYLEQLNIESRPLWKPMHLQPLYRGAKFVGGQVAERLFETGLALPSGSAMSDSDMDRVLDAITAFLESR